MRFLKEERGVSLVEVVASIVLITIILLSFFSFFIQSKKTHVASESIVDATYIAQQEMEELYGFISNRNAFWLNNPANKVIELSNVNKNFTYKDDIDCGIDCKRFVLTNENDNGILIYDESDWIELAANTQYPNNNLVNVIVSVPKDNSTTSVVMETIFRWGN
ncbi:type IV pilus modification PilV family protein [Solibacillus isronensis]|uniref:type IV pilus modification PilV family protein n=1 Tax=Solibacillus isronensis TaxID=412383 RepID=UPI0009A5D679|nr:hypothetical protein [Solibacillus isronensis]